MARRQGALGSPVQLRRPADGDRGLSGGRRRGPPPRDDGSGDRRLPPGSSGRAARNTSGCANTWASGVPSRARSEQRPQIGAISYRAPRDRPIIAITDFQKVEMRVGMIVDVQDFPEARNPSYKLQVDFGPFGIKRSSAAVQPWYSKPELLGRRVIAVTNFPPRQIGPFLSEVLCLGAVQSDGRVVLLRPDVEGELGARIA